MKCSLRLKLFELSHQSVGQQLRSVNRSACTESICNTVRSACISTSNNCITVQIMYV